MQCHFSCVGLFATPWTVAPQAPLSIGFSRQEYWSGLLCPPPGDLLDPGIKPVSPALQVDSIPLSPQGSPRLYMIMCIKFGSGWQITAALDVKDGEEAVFVHCLLSHTG